MLYIHDFHAAFRRPFDGGIQSVNDVPVVPSDIILYIDDNKMTTRALWFISFSSKVFDACKSILAPGEQGSERLIKIVTVRQIGQFQNDPVFLRSRFLQIL